jgi:hypothetical protein
MMGGCMHGVHPNQVCGKCQQFALEEERAERLFGLLEELIRAVNRLADEIT